MIINRLVGASGTIIGASMLAFVLLRLLPGDPARLFLGPLASLAAVDQMRREMHLNEALPLQYGQFLSSFVRGDWGFSYASGLPVTSELANRAPASLELALLAFLVACVGALVLATMSLRYESSLLDRAVRMFCAIGLGTPAFWLGLIAMIVFSQELHWLPGPDGRLGVDLPPPPGPTGMYTIDALLAGRFGVFGDAFAHLILPALTLSLYPMAYMAQILHGHLQEVSNEPMMIVVRGKGVGPMRAILRHAVPNAIVPTLTVSGLVFADLLASSVVVEKVFNWPGIGTLVANAAQTNDSAVIQTFIMLAAIGYVMINLAIDALSTLFDPRLRRA